MSEPTLILGIGNLLLGNEGVGVQFVQQLEKEEWPDWIHFLDGGTGGFHLLSEMEKYPVVVILDATMDGNPEGHVNLIQPKFASDYPPTLSAHDVGLKDLISSLYLLGKVPEVYLITISIEGIQPMTMNLTEKVNNAYNEVRKLLKTLSGKLLRRVGV